jgi:hypothetical protein
MCPARGSAGLPSSLANCCNNAWNGLRLGLAAEAALCHWWCQECKPPSFIICTHTAEAEVLTGRHCEHNITLAKRPLAVGRDVERPCSSFKMTAAVELQDLVAMGPCYMPVCQTCPVHGNTTTNSLLQRSNGDVRQAAKLEDEYYIAPRVFDTPKRRMQTARPQ